MPASFYQLTIGEDFCFTYEAQKKLCLRFSILYLLAVVKLSAVAVSLPLPAEPQNLDTLFTLEGCFVACQGAP